MSKTMKIILWIIVVVIIGGIWYGVNRQQSPTEKEPIKVGAILPLTGKAATYGKWERQGLELAVEKINNKGGVNGRFIKLIFEDSQFEPSKAVTAITKLINIDGVKIVIDTSGSSATLTEAPIAEKNKVILFTPTSSSPKITQAGDYIFRNREIGSVHGEKAAEFSFNKLGFTKAAVLYVNDEIGLGYKLGFVEKLTTLGGEILIEESHDSGENDFRSQLTKIKSTNPGILFLAGSKGGAVGLILKQSKELDLTVEFIGTITVQTPEVIEIAGEVAEGVFYTYSAFNPDIPTTKNTEEFIEKYEKRYGEKPEMTAANCYDAVNILALVIQKCDEDTDCIKDGLYQVKNYPGVSGTTTFDENGDVENPIIIKTIKNGQFVPYEE